LRRELWPSRRAPGHLRALEFLEICELTPQKIKLTFQPREHDKLISADFEMAWISADIVLRRERHRQIADVQAVPARVQEAGARVVREEVINRRGDVVHVPSE
jgi:hypothetical protein